MNRRFFFSGLWLACLVTSASAQSLNGNAFGFRSNGSASGTDWNLTENGYVGTYVKLDAPGDLTVSAQASGVASGGVNPHMNIVIADSAKTVSGFDVPSGFNTYQQTFSLPAGTYFVRTQLDNDPTPTTVDRQLTIRNLTFSGTSVDNGTFHVENSTTQSVNDGYALQAGDDYINNFRKGAAHVTLANAVPGASVHVKLTRTCLQFRYRGGWHFDFQRQHFPQQQQLYELPQAIFQHRHAR